MSKRIQVLLLGDINIDTTMILDIYPQPGQEGFAHQFYSHTGGSTANTAIVLSKMGVACGIVGCLGDDDWAEVGWRQLSVEGVDLTSLKRKASMGTGQNFVAVTPDGQRTMFGYRGANTLLNEKDIRPDRFSGIVLLHLSGYAFMENPQRDAAWKAVSIARDAGIAISLDTGLEPIIYRKDDILRLLPALDICILGLNECNLIFGSENVEEAAFDLVSAGVKLAAFKLGGNGCYLYTKNKSKKMSGLQVNCLDSTGAGDAFSAGLIYGWCRGLDLENIALLANSVGALATTVVGAGSNLPGPDELVAFLGSIEGTDEGGKGISFLKDHFSRRLDV